MGQDYNAKLISKFYKTKNTDAIADIIIEMEEIADPIFLHTIMSEYPNYKDTCISHYFVSSLDSFNGEEVALIASKIAEDNSIKNTDFIYLLPILEKHGIYDAFAIKRAELLFMETIQSKKGRYDFADGYDFGRILSYLNKAGVINNHIENLKEIILDTSAQSDITELAVYYFLRIKPTDIQFKYFLENFEDIHHDQLDISLSKEIIRWKGPLVEQLAKVILEKGCSRAKDIINESIRQKNKENEKNVEKEQTNYGNLAIIGDIIEVRHQINLKSRVLWNFDLFLQNESLLKQQKAAADEASLVGYCINLREVIQDVDSQTENHGLEKEQSLKLLNGCVEEDLNLSLNKLSLFLYSKGIINTDIFGLRTLNKVTSLLAHPKEEIRLLEKLDNFGLREDYQLKNWSSLHNSLLFKYKESLEKILLSINDLS